MNKIGVVFSTNNASKIGCPRAPELNVDAHLSQCVKITTK